jgi:hypothetical protein
MLRVPNTLINSQGLSNMRIKPNLSLLLLSLSLPAMLLSTGSGVKATSVDKGNEVKVEKQSQPFIKQVFRRDTIEQLNKVPVGGRVFKNDGGTGKEASDKGKDACDKCKESCDGPCGNILNRGNDRILPPDQLQNPGNLRRSQLKSLIHTEKPIF